MKRAIFWIFLLGILATGGYYLYQYLYPAKQAQAFRMARVERGDLVSAISATGTVQPEELIDVGAQVAGKILVFGQDEEGRPVDYGSHVKAGTILAKIDESLYAADVAQAEARLQQARARLQQAEADLDQYKARLDQAERDWARARKIGPSEALSQSGYDGFRSAHDVARANVSVGQAAIAHAKAGVALEQAALERARRNLDYCTIRSPVNGVIIDRRVNIGQTVVASLNAPSLFLLAKDLRRMQVWVSVNEADIGMIHPGQPVTFTVDAFPNEVFDGQVGKIRLNAAMTQNVVTYIVEVATDNTRGRLLPYLTANVLFEVARRNNVLMVPNMALRWQPRPEQVVQNGNARPVTGKNEDESPRTSPEHEDEPEPESARKDFSPATLWVPSGDGVHPLSVLAGLTNGVHTEVEGGGIEEGLSVVTGESLAPSARRAPSGASPFTPQIRRSPPGQ